MLSSRPYLVEAIFEWVLDNNKTPLMMVDATVDGVCVPMKHVIDNEITLNMAPSALSHFVMNKEYIQFKARFSGKAEDIYVPMEAVKAIFSREDMSGVGFTPEGVPYFAGDLTGEAHTLPVGLHEVKTEANTPLQQPTSSDKKPKRKGPPHLTLVE